MSGIYFVTIYKNASLSRSTKNALPLQSRRENESSEELKICLRTVRSRASTSRVETPLQRNECLEGLQQHATTLRATETP